MPQNLDVRVLFKRLGLKPPRLTVTFFEYEDDEEDADADDDLEEDDEDDGSETPRRKCTCCSCYFNIGPPGCDGTNCHDCGGRC